MCPAGTQCVRWPRFWKLESRPLRVHQRGLPLTIAIAAQRPQEELGLRSGAVCVPHHHLSDGQVVHKGQQSLVGSPVGARCSGSAPAFHVPRDPESPVPLPPSPLGLVSVTVAVQSRVHAAPVQATGTALDPRLGASPVEVLLFVSADPEAVRVAPWGRGAGSFQAPSLHQPLGSPLTLLTSQALESSSPGLQLNHLVSFSQDPNGPPLQLSTSPSRPPAPTCSVEQPGIVAGEFDPLFTVLGSIGQGTDFLPGCIPVLDSPQEWPLHAGACHPSCPQPVMPHNCPCPVLWGRGRDSFGWR